MIVRQCLPLLAALAMLQFLGLGWLACTHTVKQRTIVHCWQQGPPPPQPEIKMTGSKVTVDRKWLQSIQDYAMRGYLDCADWVKHPPPPSQVEDDY